MIVKSQRNIFELVTGPGSVQAEGRKGSVGFCQEVAREENQWDRKRFGATSDQGLGREVLRGHVRAERIHQTPLWTGQCRLFPQGLIGSGLFHNLFASPMTSAQVSNSRVEMERLLTTFVTHNVVCFCFTKAVLELFVFRVLLFIKHVG